MDNMKQLKTMNFPNDPSTYEIVDESARTRIEALENGSTGSNGGSSFTCGTTDLIAGLSTLQTGTLYFVYE